MSEEVVKPGYKKTGVGVIPEDWNVRLLGDFCLTYSGGTPLTTRTDFYGGNIPWITSGDLNRARIEDVDGRISQIGFDSSAAKMVKKGDIVIALYGATAGVVALTGINAAINQAILAIVPGDCDHEYLFQHLSQRRGQIVSTYTQGGQPNLSGEIIRSLLIPLPPLPEQHAIAAALSDADGLIGALETLIAKKRAIKQAAMQQLLTGRTRLPGFAKSSGYKNTDVGVIPEDWGVECINQLAIKFLNGGTPSTKIASYWTGQIPWITGADLVDQKIAMIRRYITVDAVRSSATNIVEKGNLLVTTRTGVGKLAIAECDVAISQDLTGIYFDNNQVNTEYIFRYLDFKQDILIKLNQGTSISGITRDTLMDISISIPYLPEQTAIATVLSEMDAEITALEQRLDKTRQIKQGMMQQLLTGKVRLVTPKEVEAAA